MDTGLVAIIQQDDVRRKSSQKFYLIFRESRTTVGHHILQSALVHGNHIGIALNHIHTVFLGNGFLTLVQTIQLALLVVDFRVGRVHVFLLHTLGTRIQQSSTKGHHLSTYVEPGEDNTTRIAIVHTLLAFDTQARLNQELLLIARFLSGNIKRIAL